MAVKTARKTNPIPVRLDAALHGRVKRAAVKMGSSSSGVIRFSILQQLRAIEAGYIRLEGGK